MKVERLEHSRVKVSLSATKEDFNEGLDYSFQLNNEKVTIKGFRKGKAPKSVYLKHYAVESLYADAVDYVANKYIEKEVLPCKDFQMISRPEIDLDFNKLAEDKGFDFTLEFDVFPEVKLGEYKGIEVKGEKAKVSAAEVTAELERVLGSKVEMKEVKRAAKMGDTVKIDFKGFKGEEAFQGGEAADYELKLGSGSFIPGFEEGVVGMNKDETKDIEVTFPENYFEESLKGQPVRFNVTVKEIKAAKLPEITEELLKEIGYSELKTEEELKEALKAKLLADKENQILNKLDTEVLNKVSENATVDLPNVMVEDRYNYFMQSAENQAKQYNIPLDMLLSFQGTNLEDFKKQAREDALNSVKFEVVLSKIAEEEKIQPTEEEVTKMVEDYAKSRNMTKEDLLKQIDPRMFFEQLLLNKAREFVLENKKVL